MSEHMTGTLKHIRQRNTDDSHDLMLITSGAPFCVATCGKQSCDDGIVAANAARLALCWNSHDELVNALKELLTASEIIDGQDTPDADDVKHLLDCQDAARAALSKEEAK